MNNKAPAYQWYPKDYLSDENVALMTLEQEGAYRRLLDYCWLQGSIPSDPTALARLCRVSTEDMERLWPGVEKCFRRGGDRYTHPRLDIERRRQEAHRKAKSAAGKAGAKAKWDKADDGSATILPMAKDGSSSSSASAIASSTAETSSHPSHERAREDVPWEGLPGEERLRVWLGPLGGVVGRLPLLAAKGIGGAYCTPLGTAEYVWGDLPEALRPTVLADACERWLSEGHPSFHAKLFRRILEDSIRERASPRGPTTTKATGTDGPPPRQRRRTPDVRVEG